MQTIEHQQQKQLNNTVQIVNSPIKHDLLFGIDGMMMFPESISEKMLPLFDSDLLKLEQRVMLDDEIRRHDFQNSCAVGLLSPSIQMHPIMNSEVMPVECHIIKEEHQDQVVQDQVAQDQEAQDQVVKVELIEVEIIEAKTTETIETSTETNGRPKRKIRKPEKLNDANLYVKHLLQEDTRTSPHKSNGYVEKKAANTKRRDHRKSSDENQFVSGLCEQCGLTFSNSNEYKKHIRNHEDKGKPKMRKNRKNVSIFCEFPFHLFHKIWKTIYFSVSFSFSQKDVSLYLQFLLQRLQSQANLQYSSQFTHACGEVPVRHVRQGVGNQKFAAHSFSLSFGH